LDERGRAILPHLQDFLLWERTRSSGEASEEDGWIESYPLFFTNTNRRWSFLTLRESIDAGQTLLFIAPGADVSVGVGNVALRGVAPAYVSRLFPDSLCERVPDLPGVVRVTSPSQASASLPLLSEKEVMLAPTPAMAAQKQETKPLQPEGPPPAPQKVPLETAEREPAPARRTETPHSLTTQSDGEPGVLKLAHNILAHLHGRPGLKLPGQSVPPLHLQRLPDGGLLDIRGEERWNLNDADPLMKAMLDSSLSDSEKSAYLASLVYTAANRDLSSVTDEDDVKFQQALAEHLTEGFNHDR